MAFTFKRTDVIIGVCICVCMYLCMYVFMYVCIYVCMCVCMYVHIHVHLFMYIGADVIMMMFDITREKTFYDLYTLKDVIAESLYPTVLPQDKIFLLVGNKIDLEKHREVSTATAEILAEEIEAHFVEVSAKTGVNFCDITKFI